MESFVILALLFYLELSKKIETIDKCYIYLSENKK